MALYLSVIGIAMGIIAVCNILLETAPWYSVLIGVVWCTALQFGLDGAIAICIKLLPDRWFPADARAYRVSEREKRLYQKLRVRRWKDKVWELGGIGGFSKKNLQQPDDPKHIEKFIIECHKGVLTHRLCYGIGFLAMLTVDGLCVWTVALPVALVNVFLNVLPTMVLRYNTPKLQALLKRLCRKQPE